MRFEAKFFWWRVPLNECVANMKKLIIILVGEKANQFPVYFVCVTSFNGGPVECG